MSKSVVVASAARTPVGSFNGSFANTPAHVLGTVAIKGALEQAGASLADVVRVNYYLPDAAEFEHCWPILSETFGENPPAATMIECNLIDPKFRIEIEVMALVR